MSDTRRRIDELFGTPGTIETLLGVEVALVESQAELGIVPVRSAEVIRTEARLDAIDLDALVRGLAATGNPVTPLVEQLVLRVAAVDPEASGHVHLGPASQDILDSALVLTLRRAAGPVRDTVARIVGAAADLARRYATTPIAGRTLLQQAVPVTFGLKAAGWAHALARADTRLASALDQAMVLQLGGAAGTMAGFGAHGATLAQAFGRRLDLAVPVLPWHAYRDRTADVAAALGITIGVMGKIARDLSLLAQTEVGEVGEGGDAGRGRSSSIPLKRNLVGATPARSAALRAPGLVATLLNGLDQEHERGTGGWQAEWEIHHDLFGAAASAADGLAETMAHLQVHPGRMSTNLRINEGAVCAEAVSVALSVRVGKSTATRLVREAHRLAAATGRPLDRVFRESPEITGHLPGGELERLLDPTQATGPAEALIERALADLPPPRGPGD